MRKLINAIKGAIIGISVLVPGVSGGTMAIILGLYDDIIHSISSFFKDWKKNTLFLAEIGVGAVVGMALFSKLISLALEYYRFPMTYLFLGVICGGLPVLYMKTREVSKDGTDNKKNNSWWDLLYLIAGFLIVVLMTSEPGTVINLASSTGVLSFLFLLLAGFIIAVALILPGISTSFMLLTLGLYEITINAINDLNISFLIPVALGCGIGVLVTTRILENLLQKHTKITYLLILGFVIGSIIEVFPGIPKGMDILYSLITALAGFLLIRFMSKYTS